MTGRVALWSCLVGLVAWMGLHAATAQETIGVAMGLGSRCVSGTECTAALGNGAQCKNGTCSCQDGFKYTGARCAYKIGLVGDKCSADIQVCHLELNGDNQHVSCVNGTCQCESAYVPSQNNSVCVAMGLGSRCVSGTECTAALGNGAQCKNGTCSCQDGFKYTGARCAYKIGLVGDKCSADIQVCHLELNGNNQHVSCVNGTCQCESAYVPSQNNSVCVARDLGSSCVSGPECTAALGDGGQCKNGTCSCQEGFKYTGTRCAYKKGVVGDECSADIQVCHLELNGDNQHVSCVDGTCQCEYSYVASQNNSVCVKGAKFGEACNDGPQCTWILGDGGQCKNGTCSCQDEFLYSANRCFYKIGSLGTECDLDRQMCYLENDGGTDHVACSLGTCRCVGNYIPSKNNDMCAGTASSIAVSLAVLAAALSMGLTA